MHRTVKCVLISVIIVAGLLAPRSLRAETADEARIRELQARYDQLEQEAAAKRAVIATTQAQADTLKRAITILQNQIGAVQAEISATQAKIDQTNIEIGTVQDEIGQKSADISRKRETVGRMIFFLDQVDQQDLVASLFRYTSLSEFFSQLHDIANVQDKVMAVIGDIKEAKAALEADKTNLETKQQELQRLSDEAAQRKNQLAGVKGEKAQVLSTTKGQEAAYQKQLATIEDQKATIFKELREYELKVISGGLYIVHIKATSVPPKGTKLFTLPEDNPRLTQGYGCTTYARCGRTRGPYGGAPHNGIDYSSGLGTPIKAIGSGQIVANGTNDGWGNWIAIEHSNNMVSLYGHMSSFAPTSKVGVQVNQGQVIGYEGRTGAATGSHVHLSLYTEFFTFLNAKNQLYFNYFEGTVNPLNYL